VVLCGIGGEHESAEEGTDAGDRIHVCSLEIMELIVKVGATYECPGAGHGFCSRPDSAQSILYSIEHRAQSPDHRISPSE
jgi:hypothetical protein